ncbi:MAG: RagB/SusD family nutrient uptake outer membrane protein [Bacteroidia bacterium]|nr:RagB/SusD family nutrient uptake outer membrane protein [Bacteroidia bacterium]
MKRLLLGSALIMMIMVAACDKEFLNRQPLGVLSEDVLATEAGVDALLIAAYAEVDGFAGWSVGAPWLSAGSNWVYGNVTGTDAYKGSDAGDQIPIVEIERFVPTAGNEYFRGKWFAVYDGVSRCNDVMRVLAKADEIAADRKNQIAAEARFLRAHYHFEAKKMWNNVPYLDETVTDPRVPNNTDIWPNIEADLQFAFDNLPVNQAQVGRATKFAAASLLAKAHLFQGDYAAAKPLLEQVINSGKYSLEDCFNDNFNAATQLNNSEIIFAVQNSVNDGSIDGENGAWGDVLNYPYTAGPGTCCGFNQPTQNLVNAYQTENGLPLLDTYNNTDVKSDQGISSSSPFEPHTGPLDPRLDWTVGRRGIPYLDWGPHGGQSWTRDQAYGGPYSPIKNVYFKSQDKTLSTASGWAQGANANNTILIRYADVLLWAAECEVEVGSLEKAREYVNIVRARAKNGCMVRFDNGDLAANYQIELYNAPWSDQATARKAVRFERRLELGMEGHRFFDLVRWGIAEAEINAYVAKEKNLRTYLNGVVFKPNNNYFPIPRTEIQNSFKDGQPTLTQNPGY